MLKLLNLLINIPLVICGPKYPYVFLLDVGHEGTTSEQVRLKITGGSATLRYPAIPNGDVISHIRVTGVDYGANLMATVVEGGPGCGYAVIAVAGEKNTPYEVVISFDTLRDTNEKYEENHFNMIENIDSNDSSEDTDTSDQYSETSHYDSNNNYKTPAVKEESIFQAANSVNDGLLHTSLIEHQNNDQVRNIEKQELTSQHNQGESGLSRYHQNYKYDTVPIHSQNVSPYKIEIINPNQFGILNDRPNSPIAEPYSFDPNLDKSKETDEDRSKGVVDQNLYEKYEALRPHLAANVKLYTSTPYVERQYDEAEEIDQMFNDEEIHNFPVNFKDSGNLDDDDPSAVEY